METFIGVFCVVSIPYHNIYSRHGGGLLFPLPVHGASLPTGVSHT